MAVLNSINKAIAFQQTQTEYNLKHKTSNASQVTTQQSITGKNMTRDGKEKDKKIYKTSNVLNDTNTN